MSEYWKHNSKWMLLSKHSCLSGLICHYNTINLYISAWCSPPLHVFAVMFSQQHVVSILPFSLPICPPLWPSTSHTDFHILPPCMNGLLSLSHVCLAHVQQLWHLLKCSVSDCVSMCVNVCEKYCNILLVRIYTMSPMNTSESYGPNEKRLTQCITQDICTYMFEFCNMYSPSWLCFPSL